MSGTGGVAEAADITIINYEIVHAHRARLALRRPRALVLDESHYVKNPRAKRTQAVRKLAESLSDDALRLALLLARRRLNDGGGADRTAARDRPARGLRWSGRALRPPLPGRGGGGAHPLAPAAAVLRAEVEGRRAAPAPGQAPGRRAGGAGERARVPAGRA